MAEVGQAPLSPVRLSYRRAASALTVFEPHTLAPVGSEPDAEAFGQFLLEDCEIVPSRDGNKWRVRDSVRAETLGQLDPEQILAAMPPGDATADPTRRMFEAYISGHAPPLAEQTVEELYATVEASEWLEGVTSAVPAPEDVRGHLEVSAVLEPLRVLVGPSFVGRERELDELNDYVGVFAPTSTRRKVAKLARRVLSLEERPPLVVHGPFGVGKSTLISKFLVDHATVDESRRFPYAYLNCDRTDLSRGDAVTFLVEAAAQLAGQYPQIRGAAESFRLDWLSVLADRQMVVTESSADIMGVDTVPEAAVSEFAGLADRIGRKDAPLLLVFDTFEEIQRRGFSAVEAVWRLVELLQPAFPRLRTVFVGRARIEGHTTSDLAIEGLPDDVARAFLRSELGEPVDEDVVAWTVKHVGGAPLALKLAADVLRSEGRDGLRDLRRRSLWSARLNRMQVEGLLYRRVLDHIEDPDVRKIANPGLALRRITPEVIREVLARPCGLRMPDDDAARRLFDGLRAEVYLFAEAEDGAAIHHRRDIRRPMLALLRQDDPRKLDQIHRAAVRYYRGQTGHQARAEELYHRLSLGQTTDTLDNHWEDAAGPFLESALDELPPRGQAYLAHKLGLAVDTDVLRESDDETWRRQAARHVSQLIAAGRLDDALDLLRQRRRPDRRVASRGRGAGAAVAR